MALASLIVAQSVIANPWRLSEAAVLPKWATLSGSFRVRFENLDNQFRAGGTGGDQILVLRTLVQGAISSGSWRIGAELEDARQELADNGTPLSTAVVNSAELLQAYLQWHTNTVFGMKVRSELTLGRQTMDFGSRRLIARNRYRNTANAFTGIHGQLSFGADCLLRAFYVMPVIRLPEDFASLLDNDTEFDDEQAHVRFWGFYASDANMLWGDAAEVYLYILNEDDSSEHATRNRDLRTFGVRLYRDSAPGTFDYQLESVIQWGESRISTTAAVDLNHLAHFHHAELGYRFKRPWVPRLSAQMDYASGDDNPNDGDNNRFDTLFGARRFDFGPTGIYGPFARSNLVSPGWRLEIQPSSTLSALIAHRAFWLESNRDAWTTASVVDATGKAGSYLGQQVEVKLRWDFAPGNVQIETGAARLFKGHFANNAPDANSNDDPFYIYFQTTLSF